jgi:hypothetical protein
MGSTVDERQLKCEITVAESSITQMKVTESNRSQKSRWLQFFVPAAEPHAAQ